MSAALRVVERDGVDKNKALEAALGQIERAFGKGSVMKLGARTESQEIEVISTGSLQVSPSSRLRWEKTRMYSRQKSMCTVPSRSAMSTGLL